MTAEDFQLDNYPAYRNVKLLTEGPYKGHFAHTAAMMFTVGVQVSAENFVITRWCYSTYIEAKRALDAWSGVGDPPGNWIKQKGFLPDGTVGDRSRVPSQFEEAR